MLSQQEPNQQYADLLESENKIKLLEPYKGAKIHHKMQCLTCGHVWTATPISKRQTFKKYGVSGCPNCNAINRNTKYTEHRQQVLQSLKERGIEILDPTYDGRLRLDYTKTLKEEKILVRNTHCGHEFYVTPLNLIQSNVECTICGPKKRIKAATAWSKANSLKWSKTASKWQQYKSTVTSLTEQTYTDHKEQINPNNLPRGKAGIDGAYHLDHIVPKRFCFDNNIPAEICAHYTNLQMIGWRENVGSRNNIKGTIPPSFFQYISTGTKLEQYASQLKTILPNSKLFVNIADIIVTCYDESSNHAIVVIPIDQSQGNLKTAIQTQQVLEANNINYTILFEDEMLNEQLLRAKLLHYTKQNDASTIFARQCTIRICSKEEKKQLLNSNHVQGNDNATICYGAYFQNELVAVMTFCPPRIALGQRTKNDNGVWELSRFCTDVKYRIPGIASKLLTHFKRHNTWTEIYSYADKRWSVGTLYYALGFELIRTTQPDYYYIVDNKRKHRWNYRKDIIKNTLPNYNPELTEYQNMVNNGFWRVWDCGSLKFSMKR